jgi:predicted enzyme related to lactoylglutathione lyase
MTGRRDPVIHFELPAKDMERARAFYERAFGWQTTPLGAEMGNFTLAFTTQTDEKSRMPTKRGAINGGFYERTKPDDQVKLTILVKDVHAAMKRVHAAGGKVLGGSQGNGEPDEIPDVGSFANVLDPEGNLVTLYEDRSPDPTPGQRALME